MKYVQFILFWGGVACFIAAAVVLLTACSTIEGATGMTFDNRVACTVAGDKAVVVSEYGGRIGISSTISEVDRPFICGKTK